MEYSKYLVVEGGSVNELNSKVNKLINEGYKPQGSHQVVTKHVQNRFAGNSHRDTVYTNIYSQTMILEED